MYKSGIISTQTVAATAAEMARSTLIHGVQGRRSAEDCNEGTNCWTPQKKLKLDLRV